MQRIIAILSLLAFALPAGCEQQTKEDVKQPFHQASAQDGAELINTIGCGGCHTIPGIRNANGLVGPPLTKMGRRMFIAGMLRNTPDNMVAWLQDPQAVVPGNAMPNMGLERAQAEAITNYLYTLQ